MGIAGIDSLGTQIEKKWRAIDYSLSAFPELAERSLREADLPAQLSPDDLVAWALRSPTFPLQADPSAKFGQPPLTLFRGPRFYIDALYWVDGTTSIHQHGFSGAFQVLAGSSIESTFSFAVERKFDGHFALGAIEILSSNLLSKGDVRPIWSGSALIHSVFHLDRPSVTIVVRTVGDPTAGPQFNYVRAGIARNPFYTDDSMERRLQIVSMLRTIQHISFESLAGELIADADLHTAYRVLRECVGYGSLDNLLERVRDRTVVDRFRRAVQDQRREAFLIGRRNVVSDPELRFFLGVLLNAQRRRDVLRLAAQRNPQTEPARQVAAWLRQLSKVKTKLQVDGIPWQPNLLGLPEFDDELERACLDLLTGRPVPAAEKVITGISQLRAVSALSSLFED